MKKHLILLAIVFGLSASMAFSMNSDPKDLSEKSAIPDKTETKLSAEEISQLSKRVEEIRDMDKSDLTPAERLALKNELKENKKELKDSGPFVYLGGVSLLLIIILVILLV